jgi:hypothetical protein
MPSEPTPPVSAPSPPPELTPAVSRPQSSLPWFGRACLWLVFSGFALGGLMLLAALIFALGANEY